MVLFALSCVGLLLFLWLSFGGSIPFNPQGYEIRVAFPNAQELAKAIVGIDQNLSSGLANLPTFAADASDVLQVLDIEHASVTNLVRDGGTVFAALSSNQAALRSLITSAESVFSTTAANGRAI